MEKRELYDLTSPKNFSREFICYGIIKDPDIRFFKRYKKRVDNNSSQEGFFDKCLFDFLFPDAKGEEVIYEDCFVLLKTGEILKFSKGSDFYSVEVPGENQKRIVTLGKDLGPEHGVEVIDLPYIELAGFGFEGRLDQCWMSFSTKDQIKNFLKWMRDRVLEDNEKFLYESISCCEMSLTGEVIDDIAEDMITLEEESKLLIFKDKDNE